MNLEPYKAKLEGKTFIIVIGQYYNMGGAEAAAIILGKELRKQYDAKVIFVAGTLQTGVVKEYIESLGFKALHFSFAYNAKPIKKVISYFKLVRFFRMQKPDYLLPYIGGNNKMVLPIWKYTGAKYSWWMQQDEGRGLYKTKFEKWLISQASDVISNSVVGMDFMEDAYGLNKDKMVHYNNVINVPDAEGLKPYWKSHLGIKEDVIVVSMIANITPFKDHKTLFKAWRSVENHFKLQQKDVFLLLAGRPEDKVLQELKILGFDLHISNSICFLGGTKRTNELINESDLVVHSSLTEGCPNAVCEAMALQKAVVGTNIPGNAEALTDTYKDFCLSNPKDANDLSEKIIYLLENPKLRSEIGIFNKERIIEHYNSNQMLEKLSKCFAKV